MATQTQLLGAASDTAGQDMIGISYNLTAARHNTENIGLEVVWPYGLIGDDSGALTALAQRTFSRRSYVNVPDWTYEYIHGNSLVHVQIEAGALEPLSLPNGSLRHAQVAGAANAATRVVGPVTIGVR